MLGWKMLMAAINPSINVTIVLSSPECSRFGANDQNLRRKERRKKGKRRDSRDAKAWVEGIKEISLFFYGCGVLDENNREYDT